MCRLRMARRKLGGRHLSGTGMACDGVTTRQATWLRRRFAVEEAVQ
jgi:hypothetical protein